MDERNGGHRVEAAGDPVEGGDAMRRNQSKSTLPLHAGTRREFGGSAVAAGAMALLPAAARGQERFPAKNIRIIVPFPAGATTDMLVRLFAQRTSDGLNQAVVV